MTMYFGIVSLWAPGNVVREVIGSVLEIRGSMLPERCHLFVDNWTPSFRRADVLTKYHRTRVAVAGHLFVAA